MTRPIRWDLVEQNYDQMIKYATAIRQGTASTEAILRRFTRPASHPAYQAMLEVGRAQRTIFVARYLRDRNLQREITEGLNVVEAFNGANSVIYYGKDGEIASNRQEEQELSVLCLRILHAALIYVNTLMLQDVLAEDECAFDNGAPFMNSWLARTCGLLSIRLVHLKPYSPTLTGQWAWRSSRECALIA